MPSAPPPLTAFPLILDYDINGSVGEASRHLGVQFRRTGPGERRVAREEAFLSIAAEIREGRIPRPHCFADVRAVFHRPHPRKETDKGAVKSLRRFLVEAEIEP